MVTRIKNALIHCPTVFLKSNRGDHKKSYTDTFNDYLRYLTNSLDVTIY